MRYVAFFLLLLLSFYFLFLKPYLTSKRIFYRVEGISLHLSPPSIKVESFYLYLPLRGRYYFLSLRDLRVAYERRLKLSLKEGIFNSVVERSGRSKPSAPKLYVPEFLKESEVRIERFLLNFVGRKATSILLEGISLKERRLRGRAKVLTDGLTSHVLLEGAFLGEKRIFVEKARVWSDLFDFELRGSVEEGNLRAGFIFKGKIERIERGPVRIEPLKLEGNGTLDYRELDMKVRGVTQEVEVKGRLKLKEVKTDSELKVEFGGPAYLQGKVWNELTSWDYRFDLFPRRVLEARTESFPVDSDLLRVPYLVFAWVRGKVLYRMDEGKLYLSLKSDSLSVESLRFGSSVLDLDYDLRRGEGRVSLTASDPGYLNLEGDFRGRGFEGNMDLRNLFIAEGNVSTCLSYRGRIGYEGKLRLKGEGRFRDLSYRSLPIGSGGYRIDLEGERIELSYGGEGFSGYVRGSLGKGIISITDLSELSRKFRGVKRGRVEFSSTEGSFAFGVEVSEGRLSRGKIEGLFSGSLKISKGRTLRGSYRIDLRDLKVHSKKIRKAEIEGVIRDRLSEGTYRADEILKGRYTFRIDKKLLRTEGNVRLDELNLTFDFEGSPERGSVEWEAEITYLEEPIRLKGRGNYRGEVFHLSVDPTDYERGTFRVRFGGLNISGNMERADLNLKEIRVSVLGRPVAELIQKKGWLSLKRGGLGWEGELRGALDGKVELTYLKEFSFLSEGLVNLGRLSFFTATPLGGKARGKLAYSLIYKEGNLDLEVRNAGKVITYSRFFSLPLEAWIDLRALDRSLAAFITLWKEEAGLSANVGSIDLKDYYIYLVSRDLPLLYRDDNLTLSLEVSSEGWVNVEDLKKVDVKLDALLSGDVEIRKFGGRKRSKAVPVKLDVRFENERPIRISLPEGYLYANVRGWVAGSPADPRYGVELELLSGELRYFGRTFFIRGGVISSVKDVGEERTSMDMTLVSPDEDISIFLNLRGDIEDLQLVIWSEPPRDTKELLTKLIIGSTAEGVIPVARALFKQLGYVGDVRSGLASLLGVEISFSTQTGSQGEIGFGVNVRKKIARAFSIEYQQSTLKDPRATYYGGSLSLPGGFSFYSRIFSDRSSEIKLRFIRKFDF